MRSTRSHLLAVSLLIGMAGLTCPTVLGGSGPLHVSMANIQGAGHKSLYVYVAATGIVTERVSNRFYAKDRIDDGDPAMSKVIFVLTKNTPTFTIGSASRQISPENVTRERSA